MIGSTLIHIRKYIKKRRMNFLKIFVLFVVVVVVLSARCNSTEKVINQNNISSDEVIPRKIKGVSLPVWEKDGYFSEKFTIALEEIKEIGANFVAIIPTVFQNDITESLIFESEKTPSDEGVIHAIKTAKQKGFHVMLKPHLDLTNQTIYRGLIDPKDIESWEKNYMSMILKYARIANQFDVEILCIGTELENISFRYPEIFEKVIRKVREIFKGKLIYAANWTEYKKISFWDKLDFVGIDAYFPIANSTNPIENELIKNWELIFSDIYEFKEKTGKEVVFTEIGYLDKDGTCIQPFNWLVNSQEDQEEQALCYNVALNFALERIKGVFIWEWEFYKVKGESGYSPRGKRAEGYIKEIFGRFDFTLHNVPYRNFIGTYIPLQLALNKKFDQKTCKYLKCIR